MIMLKHHRHCYLRQVSLVTCSDSLLCLCLLNLLCNRCGFKWPSKRRAINSCSKRKKQKHGGVLQTKSSRPFLRSNLMKTLGNSYLLKSEKKSSKGIGNKNGNQTFHRLRQLINPQKCTEHSFITKMSCHSSLHNPLHSTQALLSLTLTLWFSFYKTKQLH